MAVPDLTRFTCDGLALAIRESLDRLLPGIARTARVWMSSKAWQHFGYARVGDHARESLSRSGRWLRDRAALGEALERVPALERALTDSRGCRALGQVAALALARIVTPESVDAWVALARRVTVRSLRDALRAAREHGSVWPPDDAAPRPADADADARSTSGRSLPDPTSGEASTQQPRKEEVTQAAGHRTIRMPVPAAVRDLFDETRELHAAVCGREQSVQSLIEALVAETQAGPEPVDLAPSGPSPHRRPSRMRAIEESVHATTAGWKHLPAQARPEERRAIRLLVDVENLLDLAGSGGPEELYRQLTRFVELEDGLQRELGRLLLLLGAGRAYSRLDFTGTAHYAEQRLGMSRTTFRDRVALARGAAERPELHRAYETGDLRFQSALLLLRFLRRDHGCLDPDAERAWIRHAGQVSVKRLRDEIRLRSGEGVEKEMPALVHPPTAREWYDSLRRAPGDTGARLRALGPRAARMPAATTVWFNLPAELATDFLAVIGARRRGLERAARGLDVDVEPRCPAARRDDGTDPRLFSTSEPRLVGTRKNGASDETSPSSPLGAVAHRDEEPGPRLFSTPGARSSRAVADDVPVAMEVARQMTQRCGHVPMWVGLLAILEDYISTWDDPRSMPWRPSRRIYERDGWRCAAPGCTSRRHLESHHIVYRSRGGDLKADENQVCLCRFHHQQGEHGSFAAVDGVAPLGLLWRLGRRSVGRFFRNESRLSLAGAGRADAM
ncbi:MAG: HNH endonuclease [Acidobacteriota bacterium]